MRTLTRRELNRAALDRQMLLERRAVPAAEAVALLGGLNAQDANLPYLYLWARLEGFDKDELTKAMYDRHVVRSSVLRATQFWVAADDFVSWRPTLRPLFERSQRGVWGRALQGVDLEELIALTREHLAGRTLTRPELGRLLAERWPGHPVTALAWSAQLLVPVLHPPPSGTWGKGGATPFVLAEDWLGRPPADEADPENLIRRQLSSVGPSSVKDIQTWCGLTRLKEVVEGMELRTYKDEDGRLLYDLPEATIPDPETPAPVRLLPHFDNIMLGHDNRTRFMTDDVRKRMCVGAETHPAVLVDGEVKGKWALKAGAMTIDLFEPVDREPIAEEAARLLSFAGSDAAVTFT